MLIDLFLLASMGLFPTDVGQVGTVYEFSCGVDAALCSSLGGAALFPEVWQDVGLPVGWSVGPGSELFSSTLSASFELHALRRLGHCICAEIKRQDLSAFQHPACQASAAPHPRFAARYALFGK